MKSRFRITIGIITFCREGMDLRLEVMKKALPELRKLKSENVYFTLWDNGSFDEAKSFLRNLDFIDFKYFSNANLYDVAPIQFLSRAGSILDTDYVCHMEDDLLVCNENCSRDLNLIMNWMDKEESVGGTRILKWEINNTLKYDKEARHSTLDYANMISHRNVVSNERLAIQPIFLEDEKTGTAVCRVAKTNWHWYNFPVVCKTNVYSSIIPRDDIEPLQAQEGYMMKSYFKTGMLMGAHDGGLVTHLAPPNPESKKSARYLMKSAISKQKSTQQKMGRFFPILSMDEVKKEVDIAIEELKKCLDQN